MFLLPGNVPYESNCCQKSAINKAILHTYIKERSEKKNRYDLVIVTVFSLTNMQIYTIDHFYF